MLGVRQVKRLALGGCRKERLYAKLVSFKSILCDFVQLQIRASSMSSIFCNDFLNLYGFDNAK